LLHRGISPLRVRDRSRRHGGSADDCLTGFAFTSISAQNTAVSSAQFATAHLSIIKDPVAQLSGNPSLGSKSMPASAPSCAATDQAADRRKSLCSFDMRCGWQAAAKTIIIAWWPLTASL
jgi:hypothetical protein